MKQKRKLVLVALALGLFLAACSTSSGDEASSDTASSSGDDGSESSFSDDGGDDEAMVEDDGEGDEAMAEDGSDDGAMEEDGDGGEAANAPEAEPTAVESAASLSVGPESVDPTAKIIFEADATIEAEDVAAAVNKAQEEATLAGGYVSESNVSLSVTGSATMTMRVPAGQFDDLLDAIRGIGTPLSTNVSTDDVSLEYVDIVARIDAQERSLARVKDLLGTAGNTDQILRLEREVAQRQGDLDALIGRKNFLDNRVRLSTIRLRIEQLVIVEEVEEPAVVEAEPEPEPEPPAGFSDGLEDGVDSFLSVARVLSVVVGVLLPFLPFLLIGGFVLNRWKRNRDSRRFQATPTPPLDLGATASGSSTTAATPPSGTTTEAEKEPVGSGAGIK